MAVMSLAFTHYKYIFTTVSIFALDAQPKQIISIKNEGHNEWIQWDLLSIKIINYIIKTNADEK